MTQWVGFGVHCSYGKCAEIRIGDQPPPRSRAMHTPHSAVLSKSRKDCQHYVRVIIYMQLFPVFHVACGHTV